MARLPNLKLNKEDGLTLKEIIKLCYGNYQKGKIFAREASIRHKSLTQFRTGRFSISWKTIEKMYNTLIDKDEMTYKHVEFLLDYLPQNAYSFNEYYMKLKRGYSRTIRLKKRDGEKLDNFFKDEGWYKKKHKLSVELDIRNSILSEITKGTFVHPSYFLRIYDFFNFSGKIKFLEGYIPKKMVKDLKDTTESKTKKNKIEKVLGMYK